MGDEAVPNTLPIFSGIAGQYLVAAELSKRNIVATVTLRNTRGIDVLASNDVNSHAVSIQVKTNRGRKKTWLLNMKAETPPGPHHFYVFVNLNGGELPDFHIVPSKTVAKAISTMHKAWLAGSSKSGRKRQDSPMRKFMDAENAYKDRWDILGLED
jgi:hypothetical protein